MKFFVTILATSIAAIHPQQAMTSTPPKHVSLELEQESSERPLQIKGMIPSWLSGTLVRNGPVTVTVDGKANAHWFDGLAMLHAFTFENANVVYANRFLRTDAYKTVFEEGSLNYSGFASDPCRSLFQRFFTWLFSSSEPALHNANVNIAKIADQYVALTEVPLPVRFDRQTLDTLGVLNYQDELPKDKCWESAHPHYDNAHKETINYLIKYGRTSFYTLYRIQDETSERKIIAEIPVDRPSYMHSFALTENYVVFTEFPFRVNPIDMILSKQAFIKNFKWMPDEGTRFIVVERATGKVAGEYTTSSFFAFHHAAAFEQKDELIIDVVCYDDAAVITGVADHFKEESGVDVDPENALTPSRLMRYTLSMKTNELSSELILKKPIEFPRINDAFDSKPYRYMYLTDPRDYATAEDIRPLYKIDMQTKQVLSWAEKGCYPGELVFVPKPDSQDEDDGVVMTIVLDHLNNGSFLLILDGKTFQEVARAVAPYAIPAGLHAQFFD